MSDAHDITNTKVFYQAEEHEGPEREPRAGRVLPCPGPRPDGH